MTVDLVSGLLKRAEERYVAGDLAASLAAGQEAERVALAHGREDLADRAFCNCCPALLSTATATAPTTGRAGRSTWSTPPGGRRASPPPPTWWATWL